MIYNVILEGLKGVLWYFEFNGISERFVLLLFREEIVIWVQKKTGAPIVTVNTVDEAERFLKKYHTFVVGLFNKFEVWKL